MAQNLAGMTATGSYSDASTADITNAVAWTVSDTSIATIGASDGLLTVQAAGEIWGATIGVTATLSPGTPGTASLLVIASDSGSVAPRMPQLDTHWQALGLSPWGAYGGLQEPSGSDIVLSGSAGYTLTAVPAGGTGIHYQEAIAPWTRVAIELSQSSATTGMRLAAAAGVGPNVNTTSVAFLTYARIGNSTTQTGILGILGTAAGAYARAGTAHTGEISLAATAKERQLVGPYGHRMNDGRVHPIMVVVNLTTNEAWAYTDITLTMSGGYATPADQIKGIGTPSNSMMGSSSFVYYASCTGSIAEALSNPANAGATLQALGWDVPWATCPSDSSSIKLPFLAHHWGNLGADAGSPWTAIWNFQEERSSAQSFNMWEGKSQNGYIMTLNVPDAYHVTFPNWKRAGLQLNTISGAGGHRGTLTNVFGPTLPDTMFDQTGSFALMTYFAVTGSGHGAVVKPLISMGSSATSGGKPLSCAMLLGPTNLPIIYCAGATTTGAVAYTDGLVHPFLLVYDKTNSRVKFYSDVEKMTGSFNALTMVTSVTSSLGIGGNSIDGLNISPSGTFNYLSFCTGTVAEALSDDGRASAFLKSYGWTGTVW